MHEEGPPPERTNTISVQRAGTIAGEAAAKGERTCTIVGGSGCDLKGEEVKNTAQEETRACDDKRGYAAHPRNGQCPAACWQTSSTTTAPISPEHARGGEKTLF